MGKPRPACRRLLPMRSPGSCIGRGTGCPGCCRPTQGKARLGGGERFPGCRKMLPCGGGGDGVPPWKGVWEAAPAKSTAFLVSEPRPCRSPPPRTAGTPRAAEGPCGASPNPAGLLTSRHLLWAWSMLLLTGGGLLSACLKRWLLGWLGGGLEGWICNLCVQTQNQKQSPGISGECSMIHL